MIKLGITLWYQAAKNAQMMAQLREKQKNEKSQWDEEEEAEFREKMDALNQDVEDATQNKSAGSAAFLETQKANIVRIETSSADIAAIDSDSSLGGGVVGARVDFTI